MVLDVVPPSSKGGLSVPAHLVTARHMSNMHLPGFLCRAGAALARAFWCAALVLLCISCATTPQLNPERAFVIENVPFFPQDDYQCGPSSLATVLSFWGMKTDPGQVARDIYSRSARGTLTIDMARYAARGGLEAVQYSGGWEDLRARIESGYPMIVLVDFGFSFYQVNHFMVAVGVSDGSVIVNSGKDERLRMDKYAFLKAWARTKFWTLWIHQGSGK